jgi:copper binding protein CusF
MRPLVSLSLLLLLLFSCQRNPPPRPVREYQMRGEIVSMDTKSQTAAVKHGKIDGWMEAMTMEYPVKDQQEFAKLKVGEKIQAKILVQGLDYWIAAASEDK